MKTKIEKEIHTCFQCGKELKRPSTAWTILLKGKKETRGEYCSKGCTEDDCWGPVFRGSTIVNRRSLSKTGVKK